MHFLRFRFEILRILFNLTISIHLQRDFVLTVICKNKPTIQCRYPVTEFYYGKKYVKVSLIQARYGTKRLKIK